MGARLYNPATGRFLQVDPVFEGSANAYDYVDQDPVNASDLAGTLGGTRQGECADMNGRWEGSGPNSGRCIPGPAPHSVVRATINDIGKGILGIGAAAAITGLLLQIGPAGILGVLAAFVVVESSIDLVAAALVIVGAAVITLGVLVIVLSRNSKAD
jgi:hypothetical protein